MLQSFNDKQLIEAHVTTFKQRYLLINTYHRVTSFDALKQSTDICTHLITFFL